MIGGPALSLFGARLAQLAAFIALMWWAIRTIPWGKPLLFTIGLLPVVIQGAANVSADPITLALACCVVAGVLAAYGYHRDEPLSTRALWILGAAIAALSLSKSAYIPFALLVLAIPSAVFGSTARRVRSCAVIVGVAALLAGAWNIGVVSHVSIVGVNGSDSVAAARWIREHPIGFVKAIVHGWQSGVERSAMFAGFFSPVHRFADRFPLPVGLGFVWLLLVRLADPLPRWLRRLGGPISPPSPPEMSGAGAVQPISVPGPDRRDRLASTAIAVVVALATFGLIEYGLAIAANPVGTRHIIWVQGRYFLPLLPLSLFGVSIGQPRLPGRWLLPLPVLSTAVVVGWAWWADHHAWYWF